MTRRRWLIIALGVVSVAWILGGEWVSISRGIRENHFLDAMVGLAFVGAGLVALDRRPGNAIGPLMIAFGLLGYVANWSNLRLPVFPTLVLIGNALPGAFIVHIALAYPSGHVRRAFDRWVLCVAYAAILGTLAVTVLTFPRRPPGCQCPWTPLFFPNGRVADAAFSLGNHLAFVLAPLVLAAIVLRWRDASAAERRALAPLWIAVVVLAIVYVLSAFATPETTNRFSYLMWELRGLFQSALPIVFVWGLLSTRLARSAVGDLVVELERPSPGGLREALVRALGDRSLEIAYPVEGEGGRWVDADGRPAPPPEARDAGRTVTMVERDGKPLAALVHDPAIDDGLVRAAGAAAAMAIANERLRAEVRAQLEEVRASRERIVAAGDRERRRVERNLHDGAQQRLVTISLALAMLRDRPDLDPSVAASLRQTATELKCAIDELRELARGIHPAILTEDGLGAAVESLADRSPVAVKVTSGLDGRLPEAVEATAYYVVSEALANVAKYANATSATVDLSRWDGRLRVEVADDGVGGADVSGGSGLRGLEDRVAAVGGRLDVVSPPGAGTRIVAEMPADG